MDPVKNVKTHIGLTAAQTRGGTMDVIAALPGLALWIFFTIITGNFIKKHLVTGDDPTMDTAMAWFFGFCWPVAWIIGGTVWVIGMLLGAIAIPFVHKGDSEEDSNV